MGGGILYKNLYFFIALTFLIWTIKSLNCSIRKVFVVIEKEKNGSENVENWELIKFATSNAQLESNESNTDIFLGYFI